jgi:DNA-binding beta-propeller fold protein YncE
MSSIKVLSIRLLFALCFLSSAFAQSLIKQIDIPGTPASIAINPLLNRIYAAQNNFDESSALTYISTIDGNTNTVAKTTNGPDDLLGSIAVDVVTGRVYLVACRTLQVAEVTCKINVLDSSLNTLAVVPDVEVGSPLAVNPITHRLYYARQSLSGMAVLDTRTNTYLGRIALSGFSPRALDIDLARNQVFALFGTNRVALIDAHTSAVLHTTRVGSDDADLAVDPFRQRVYVTDFNGASTARSTLAVLNSSTLSLQKKILVGVNPRGVAVDGLSGMVFVTNDRYQTLYVINGETQLVQRKITGPRGPVEVNPITKLAYTGTRTIFIEPITGKLDVIHE